MSQFTSSDRTKIRTQHKLIQKSEDCHVLLPLHLILITTYYKQILVPGFFKEKKKILKTTTKRSPVHLYTAGIEPPEHAPVERRL